jgi:uncharacterized protein
MSTEKNIQTVKDFFAAIGHGDKEALLALVAEDIEWIIPGKYWPLRGGEFACDRIQVNRNVHGTQGVRSARDRVLVVGFARGKIKATNKRSKTTGSSPSRSGTAD